MSPIILSFLLLAVAVVGPGGTTEDRKTESTDGRSPYDHFVGTYAAERHSQRAILKISADLIGPLNPFNPDEYLPGTPARYSISSVGASPLGHFLRTCAADVRERSSVTAFNVEHRRACHV